MEEIILQETVPYAFDHIPPLLYLLQEKAIGVPTP
jgi:hypothetical protein